MIVNPQVVGQQLPDLTSPAGAGQILSGYQAINADGKIVTGTIPSQGAQTITPGTSAKTIAAGRYLSGAQTIAGDADLVPANIKSGINIFGVSGSYSGKEPVYGIYNNPAQYVDINNDDYNLNYLKITLPTPIEKVLGLNVMYFYDGLRAVMCYPATNSGSNESSYPSKADDAAVWDVAAEALSGQVFVVVGEGKLSVSGSTITLRSKNPNTQTLHKIDSVYQVAYTYIPA